MGTGVGLAQMQAHPFPRNHDKPASVRYRKVRMSERAPLQVTGGSDCQSSECLRQTGKQSRPSHADPDGGVTAGPSSTAGPPPSSGKWKGGFNADPNERQEAGFIYEASPSIGASVKALRALRYLRAYSEGDPQRAKRSCDMTHMTRGSQWLM